ncbi:MAG TPA: aminotransferase class I/II-fold pyridoxal phosphate-dependent enzyme, partial [Leucothrix sp.]|nr:aminotransferase class I/II-fold pyridoxal phosphate-dependent enzyme [Leucothrix sp.]
LIAQYPNLLITQTFSKSRSLAGLRVGFALGQPELIEGLERVKNSFNSYPLDRAAIAGATASIQDKTYFEDTCQKIIATRNRITIDLEALDFLVLPSKTNFIFAKPKSHDAAKLYQQLKEAGILVRYFSAPRIDAFLRITIGTDSEMDTFLEKLKALL